MWKGVGRGQGSTLAVRGKTLAPMARNGINIFHGIETVLG